jgi:hypothetical protein
MNYKHHFLIDGGTIFNSVSRKLFIHDSEYYLIDITIFENGIVNCWGMVDFEEFKQKIDSGRICSNPPDHANLVIRNGFHRTYTQAVNFKNTIPESTFFAQVQAILEDASNFKYSDDKFSSKLIRELKECNQRFSEGKEDSEIAEFTFRIENEEFIMGKTLSAFIHEDKYLLKEMTVFADGQIDCGEIVSFDKFKEKIHSGEICTKIPDDAQIVLADMDPPMEFTARNYRNGLDESEFIKDICIDIDYLNNRPTAFDKFGSAFKKFINDPTESNREELRSVFKLVPLYIPRYSGNVDIKEVMIRGIIMSVENPTKYDEDYHKLRSEYLGNNSGIIIKP